MTTPKPICTLLPPAAAKALVDAAQKPEYVLKAAVFWVRENYPEYFKTGTEPEWVPPSIALQRGAAPQAQWTHGITRFDQL